MSFMEQMNGAGNEPKEFGPIPDGTYNARLHAVNTTPGQDGIMLTQLEFRITEGEHNTRRLWEKVKNSDSVLWKAGVLYNGMGLTDELNGWPDWCNAMVRQIDRGFRITTLQREYEGKIYVNIKQLQPLEVPDVVPF